MTASTETLEEARPESKKSPTEGIFGLALDFIASVQLVEEMTVKVFAATRLLRQAILAASTAAEAAAKIVVTERAALSNSFALDAANVCEGLRRDYEALAVSAERALHDLGVRSEKLLDLDLGEEAALEVRVALARSDDRFDELSRALGLLNKAIADSRRVTP